MTSKMHQEIPGSKVTVSVYASAIKEPKIYDINSVSQNSDGIFMMAYDFGYSGSDSAIPTAPLYGHKEGKYWYDVSTAVEDFLNHMPAEKLILGVPYYGYNYSVSQPEVKANIGGRGIAQTYSDIEENIQPEKKDYFTSGWDDQGKVSFKAYFDFSTYTWRMVFTEDANSLGYKYDFAKNKNLGGVGVWALGFDDGKNELWDLLGQKFGNKVVDNRVINKPIKENS